MVSVIGLDAEKVQSLCDAANEEVPEEERVQIANFLCPVRIYTAHVLCLPNKFLRIEFDKNYYYLDRETMPYLEV